MLTRSVRCRASSGPDRPVARSSARSSRSRTACIGITADLACGQLDAERQPVQAAQHLHEVGGVRRRQVVARRARRACSTKARTPGCRRNASRSVASRGTGSGCRRTTYSPGAWRVTRDVASTRTPPATRRTATTSSRHASTTCSPLSRTRSSWRSASARATSSARTSPVSRSPSREATAWATRSGRATAPRATTTTSDVLPAGRDVEGQAGLADAAGPGEGDDAVGAEQAHHLLPVLLAADHRAVGARRPAEVVAGATAPAATCCSSAASAGVGSSPVSSASRRRNAVRDLHGLGRASRRRPALGRAGGSCARAAVPPSLPRAASTTAVWSPAASRASSRSSIRCSRSSSRATDATSSSGSARNSSSAGPRHSASAAAGSSRASRRAASTSSLERLEPEPVPAAVALQAPGLAARGVAATGRRGCRAAWPSRSPEGRRARACRPAARCRRPGRPRRPAGPAGPGAARRARRPLRHHVQRERTEHVHAQRQLAPVHSRTVPDGEGRRHPGSARASVATQARNRASPTACDQAGGLRLLRQQRRHLAVEQRVVERQQDRELVVGARPAGGPARRPRSPRRDSGSTRLLAGHGVQQPDVVTTPRRGRPIG